MNAASSVTVMFSSESWIVTPIHAATPPMTINAPMMMPTIPTNREPPPPRLGCSVGVPTVSSTCPLMASPSQ